MALDGSRGDRNAVERLIAAPEVSDLFGLAGRQWLKELGLPSEKRETVDSCMRQIEFLDREIEEVERLIAKDALDSPEGGAADDRAGGLCNSHGAKR